MINNSISPAIRPFAATLIITLNLKLLVIQMSGLVGFKKLLRKNALNNMIENILIVFKKLVLEVLEEYIVQFP
jgi:hypothetical protein